jgi:hypothetical protein
MTYGAVAVFLWHYGIGPVGVSACLAPVRTLDLTGGMALACPPKPLPPTR